MAATVVVAGMKPLADMLERTSQFSSVLYAGSAADLVGIVRSPQVSTLSPRDVVFVVADPLAMEGSKLSLQDIVLRLTSRKYKVLVIPERNFGGDVYSSMGDTVRILAGDFTLNSVLFGFAAFGWAVSPVRWGYDDVASEFHADERSSAAERQDDDVELLSGMTKMAPEPSPTSGPDPETVADPVVAFGWAAPAPDPEPSPTSGPDPETVADPVVAFGWAAPAPAPEPAGKPTEGLLPPLRKQETVQANEGAGSGGMVLKPPSARQIAPVGRRGASPDQTLVPRTARRGFVMTTAVSKGGTGKSSLTLNLAAFLGMRLRAQGKTVVIVDSNYQQADTGKYLDVFRPNITKLASDPALMTRARIREVLVHKPELNLSALLGPATPDEANPYSIDAKLYFDAVTLLKEHYDYILIDTPVAEKFHDLFQNFALPIADFIMVPVAPSFQTLHNADNWIRAAVVAPKHDNGAGIDPSRVGVVLNRAEEGVGCTEDDVRRTMAEWSFIGAVPETVEWKAANNNFEIIAKENYVELNNAFSQVLYAATGEEVLREGFALAEEKLSFFEKIRRNR